MEPTSSALTAGAATGLLTLTSILPWVNGDALIGAFAGAVIFALHTKELSTLKKFAYMIVSILIGYLGSGEVMHWTGIQSYAIGAFVAAALAVTAALAGIDKIRQFDITSLWKKG